MVPLRCIELSGVQRHHLLNLARGSINSGLVSGQPLPINVDSLEEGLRAKVGVFVTLTINGKLRGCIGNLQSNKALGVSVADNAFGAAFRDPRFGELESREFPVTRIEISVLSPMARVEAESRTALLQAIHPGADGLLLEDGKHRSTFLPQVWEQLTEPEHFVDQLLLKAGLPADHWSPTLSFKRYHSLSFAEPKPSSTQAE